MIKKGFFLLLLLSLSTVSSALDWYAGGGASYIQDKILNASFKPAAVNGRIGAYVQQQVGIEVYGLMGVNPYDDDVNIDLTHNYSIGVLARLESPETEDGGKIYLLLGYAATELDMDRSGTGEPGKETFTGVAYGGGVEFNISDSNKYYVNLDVMSYYAKGDISIGSLNLGFRYRF